MKFKGCWTQAPCPLQMLSSPVWKCAESFSPIVFGLYTQASAMRADDSSCNISEERVFYNFSRIDRSQRHHRTGRKFSWIRSRLNQEFDSWWIWIVSILTNELPQGDLVRKSNESFRRLSEYIVQRFTLKMSHSKLEPPKQFCFLPYLLCFLSFRSSCISLSFFPYVLSACPLCSSFLLFFSSFLTSYPPFPLPRVHGRETKLAQCVCKCMCVSMLNVRAR